MVTHLNTTHLYDINMVQSRVTSLMCTMPLLLRKPHYT